jgi:hypothetical protein
MLRMGEWANGRAGETAWGRRERDGEWAKRRVGEWASGAKRRVGCRVLSAGVQKPTVRAGETAKGRDGEWAMDRGPANPASNQPRFFRAYSACRFFGIVNLGREDST